MSSREITLWTDERWCAALEAHTGKTVEELLLALMDALKLSLPQEQQDAITAEIQKEEQKQAAEHEASRRFSVFRVTENGESHAYLAERSEDLFGLSVRLRQFLRSGESVSAQLTAKATPLSEVELEQYTAEMVNGSPRVTGCFGIDLDKGIVSALNINDGWHSFRLKDLSTAAYYATKSQAARWKHDGIFHQRLEGKELPREDRPVFIRGTEPLPVSELCFEEDMEQMDQRLNFYVPVYFDPDAVFGTDVCTDENDDTVNVYADYDMEHGCVCDTLDVYLMRTDGTELDCAYRLTPEEQEVLRDKMDAYCIEQIGLSLEDAREQYLAEEQEPLSTAQLVSEVESIRQESHQKADETCDALTPQLKKPSMEMEQSM